MTKYPIVFDENCACSDATMLLLHYEVGGTSVVIVINELVGVVSVTALIDAEHQRDPHAGHVLLLHSE
jgi:hypothetical protein